MDEFFKQLSSPSWWIGVVAIGILINIVSQPLGRIFENQLSKVSSWQRRKSQEKTEKRLKLLETLRNSESKQLLYATQEQRVRIRAFANTIYALVSLGIVFAMLTFANDLIREIPILIVFVVVFGLLSLLAAYSSLDDTRLAIEIKRNLKQVNPDIFVD